MNKHTPFMALVAAAVISGSAHAHAGDHSHFSLDRMVDHLFSQPFHVLGIVGLVAVVAYAGWRFAAKRKQR
ncbi:MAG: hypothetical protein EP335_17115 [Alphaproteobacteria bacterium]|nr:MAG: hypothetical protein EP335_17115 [Alphaproteobacteria bacterium]